MSVLVLTCLDPPIHPQVYLHKAAEFIEWLRNAEEEDEDEDEEDDED